MFHSSPGPSFPSQHPEPSFWPVASQRGLPLHHSPVHVLHKYHWGIPLFQTLRLWWGAGRALWPGVQLEGEVWWGWGYIINADFSLKLYPLSLPIGIENSEKKTKKKKKIPSRNRKWKTDHPVPMASGSARERGSDSTNYGRVFTRCAAR